MTEKKRNAPRNQSEKRHAQEGARIRARSLVRGQILSELGIAPSVGVDVKVRESHLVPQDEKGEPKGGHGEEHGEIIAALEPACRSN